MASESAHEVQQMNAWRGRHLCLWNYQTADTQRELPSYPTGVRLLLEFKLSFKVFVLNTKINIIAECHHHCANCWTGRPGTKNDKTCSCWPPWPRMILLRVMATLSAFAGCRQRRTPNVTCIVQYSLRYKCKPNTRPTESESSSRHFIRVGIEFNVWSNGNAWHHPRKECCEGKEHYTRSSSKWQAE